MLLKLTARNKGMIVVNMNAIEYMEPSSHTSSVDAHIGTTIVMLDDKVFHFKQSMEDIGAMMNYGAIHGLVFVSEKGGTE